MVEQAFFSAIEKHESLAMDFRVMRVDGEYRWVEGDARARFGDDGEFLGVIGSLFDITARKVAETQLREMNEELEHRVAERTAALRALAVELTQTEHRERKRLAQILHDEIQQLLVAMKMQAGFAVAQAETGPMLEVMELADQAIAGCRSLVTGLSPPVSRDADLPDSLQWLSRYMREQHGLRVWLELEEPAPFLSEETRSLLFDITRELLLNVVKHAGVKEATVAFWHEDGKAHIEVVDDGKGCDPQSLERPGRESFGLFSIRERIAVLSGNFDAHSEPGQGCRVRVSLPAGSMDQRREKAVIARPEQAPSPTVARRGIMRVLVADDHQILRQGLTKLLGAQRDMHVIAEASDGPEAIALARLHRPDVVIMDISMPRMGGIEATRRITSEIPGIRVIGLSMHKSEEMAAAMREAGAEAYVSKGGPIEELLRALRRGCQEPPGSSYT